MQEWVGYLQSIGEKERICKFVVDYVKKKSFHFYNRTILLRTLGTANQSTLHIK